MNLYIFLQKNLKRKEVRKMRKYFDNKRCDICKKSATRFRIILHRQWYLCDDKKCDLATRINTPFFKGYSINEGKG